MNPGNLEYKNYLHHNRFVDFEQVTHADLHVNIQFKHIKTQI